MATRKPKSTFKPGIGSVPLACGLLDEAFAKRHPHLAAYKAFEAGWITREQAVEYILRTAKKAKRR